jgi:Uncharacterized protein conserved in bacteria (DUF2125)
MTRRTRRVIWIVIVVLLLAALSGGYAWYRSYVAEQLSLALNDWILARTAEGYRIDADIAPESGNLTAVTQRVSDITVAAPGDAWTLRLHNLDILVSPLSPLSVEFQPDGRVEFGYTVAGENYLLTNEFRDGAAGFSYDRESRITGAYLHEFGARLDGQISVDFDSLESRFHFDPAAPLLKDGKSIEFNVAIENATVTNPTPLPLGSLIQHADLAAYVTGTLQPGRPSESLAAWRDAGGVLQIQRFVANWGPLAVTAEGTLTLDGQMQPLFAGTAMVRGYNETIDALAQAGMMELGQVTGAKIALAAMSKPSDAGGPPAAKLPITIQDGFLFVGPLKLAQMPRIVWQ